MSARQSAFILLTLIAFMPSVAVSQTSGVQMIPPVQSGTTDAICAEDEGNKVLTWDGETALKCSKGFVVDGATGNVAIGTATPTSSDQLIIMHGGSDPTSDSSAKLTVVGYSKQASSNRADLGLRAWAPSMGWQEWDLRVHGDWVGTDSPGIAGIRGLSINEYTNPGNKGWCTGASDSLCGVTRMYFQNGGNIGIGTNRPDHKLDVVGTVHADRMVFDTSIVPNGGGNIWIERKEHDHQSFIGFSSAGVQKGTLGMFANSEDFALSSFNGADLILQGNHVAVGSGSDPQYTLHVFGTAYATGAAGALSDARHKDNIKRLEVSGLETVAKLRPVTFEWKEPKDDGMRGEQIGFIAQDVEKVLPQVILTSEDAERTKGLKYDSLIPVLTKAIQELEAEVKQERAENAGLKARLKALEDRK